MLSNPAIAAPRTVIDGQSMWTLTLVKLCVRLLKYTRLWRLVLSRTAVAAPVE